MSAGYVYAATGEIHVALALNSARSLRRVAPDAQIDFFTDADIGSDVFDSVHRLQAAHHRPKFEALRNSRFDRTIYLDADTILLADISDVFAVLDRFDIAAAHVVKRNNFTGRQWRRPFPAALCELNGGVLAIRRSEAVSDFLMRAEQAVLATGGDDQPIIRELLVESNLRLWVLPPEYNYKNVQQAATLTDADAAPRVLHMSGLHRLFRETGAPPALASIVPSDILGHLAELLASDRYLNPGQRRRVRQLSARTPGRRLRDWLRGGRPRRPFPDL